jgi:hypothetical protein
MLVPPAIGREISAKRHRLSKEGTTYADITFILFLVSSCLAAQTDLKPRLHRFPTRTLPLLVTTRLRFLTPIVRSAESGLFLIVAMTSMISTTNADVLAFARRFQLALLLHAHCPGKAPEDRGDMNLDPSQGLG